VARPERIALLAHGAQTGNCLPGMVERTVYVGASLQVIVRLATGASVQASVTNTGETDVHTQGTPVAVHIPGDALRVLAPAVGAAGDEQPPSRSAETVNAGR
jgi:spermidine/putrescine transport system ATP-binding protein